MFKNFSISKATSLLAVLLLAICWYLTYLFFVPLEQLFMLSAPEELYRGSMAKEFLEGLKMPLYNYRPDSYNGGFFVISLFIKIFFSLFGTSAFSLKIAPMLFSVGTLAFWYLIIDKYMSRFAAITFSLLYIFAPTLFTNYLLSAMGNHPQTLFFTAFSLWIFLKTSFRETPSLALYALLGFIMGFGLWFSYPYIFTLLSIFIYAFIYDKRIFNIKTILCLALFFIIGFSPWIFSLFKMSRSSLMINDDPLWAIFQWDYFKEVFQDSKRFLGHSFWALFHSETLSQPLSWFYALSLSLCALFTFIKNNSPLVRFIKIYLVVAILLIMLWPVQGVRFYLPIIPFIFALAVITLSHLKTKPYALITLTLLVSFGFSSSALSFTKESMGTSLQVKGYSYQAFGTSEGFPSFFKGGYDQAQKTLAKDDFLELQFAIGNTFAEGIADLEEIPSSLSNHYYYAVGQKILLDSETLKKASAQLTSFANHPNFEAISIGFFNVMEDTLPTDQFIHKTLDVQALKKSTIPFFWRALGTQALKQSKLDIMAEISLTNVEKKYFFQGIGKYLYFQWQFGQISKFQMLSFFSQLGTEDKENVLYGIGIRFAESEIFEFAYAAEVYWKKLIKDFEQENLFFLFNGRNETLQFFHGWSND